MFYICTNKTNIMEEQIYLKQSNHTPERWIVLKIKHEESYIYKIFGSWAGGYIGQDSWRINSGIVKVVQDESFYYFVGNSDSCYKCHKNTYGVVGLHNKIIAQIVNKEKRITILKDKKDWELFLKKKI